MSDPVKPQRGRPRSLAAKKAILRATRQLLEEGGPGAVSMEAVAARAGVGKPTVYRWWPDRHAVTMAALMDADDEPDVASSRSPLAALRKQLANIAERLSTRTGRHVAAMIAASDGETEVSKAFRNHFVLARRAEGKDLLEQALAKGELRSGLDIEVALDLLYGPLFFRLLVGHAPLDVAFTEKLFQQALAGLRSKA